MATKLGRMVTYLDRILRIRPYDTMIMGSCHVTNENYIFTARVLMDTKICRMVTYLDALQPIK